MLNRRGFIKNSALLTGGMVAGQGVWQELSGAERIEKLTILHTNDVHSRIDPFPMDGSRNQGMGGVAARAAVIKQVRAQEEHVLLLDAGDIFQGTPYFNYYKGEPEIKAMTAMGYDACTIGNHDFDAGLENLSTQLRHARFPMLVSNYDFSSTPMEQKTAPYTILKKGKLKIGITGVGIEMDGLVPSALSGNTKYLDPIRSVNEVAAQLKMKEKCDMIICLSHLGFKYKDNKISDEILAKETEYVDLIIGGHTHTFLDEPVVYRNKKQHDVIVNQVGFAGIILGRLDFTFSATKKKNLTQSHTISIGKKTSE
jgi:5'-nucleotidase